jgi:hypothetical protein
MQVQMCIGLSRPLAGADFEPELEFTIAIFVHVEFGVIFHVPFDYRLSMVSKRWKSK